VAIRSRQLSKNVTVHFGYDDAHVEIEVRVPIPFVPNVSLRIERSEIGMALGVLEDAERWAQSLEMPCVAEPKRKKKKGGRES